MISLVGHVLSRRIEQLLTATTTGQHTTRFSSNRMRFKSGTRFASRCILGVWADCDRNKAEPQPRIRSRPVKQNPRNHLYPVAVPRVHSTRFVSYIIPCLRSGRFYPFLPSFLFISWWVIFVGIVIDWLNICDSRVSSIVVLNNACRIWLIMYPFDEQFWFQLICDFEERNVSFECMYIIGEWVVLKSLRFISFCEYLNTLWRCGNRWLGCF